MLGSKKQKIPATGFYALPKEYQNLWSGILGQADDVLLPGGQLNSEMFTPLGMTADESAAFERMRQGFAPTEQSLRQDISMFMNPFDDFVINDLNRQAQGQNSLVNQASTRAGQQGSNRSFLGTSDVEQQRLNSIGQFRQGQYNNAVNQVLGPLAGLRMQDTQNLLGIGSFERGLDSATKQAPLQALNAGTGFLNAIPTSFGNFGTPERTVKTGGGLGSLLGAAGSVAGSIFGGPVGGMIGGQLGNLAGGGSFNPSSLFSGFAGLGAGQGLWGGLDPNTGITWNSGRVGGFFG